MSTTKEKAQEMQTSEKGKGVEVSRPMRALSPFEEMDRIMESFFPRGLMRPFRMDWPSWGEMAAPLDARVPRVDVVDRDEDVLVRAELPGIKKDDLEVSVTENAVTIKGKTKHEEKDESGEYYRCEISRGAFTRTVGLPGYVDSNKTKAKFKDGVLELILPKVEKAKRRTVKID
ncbi:MAG: Hsp20/alpha crystallin family protein [Gammaproteobacteria bacterium]|jgi:HSP20 family protein